MDISEQAQIDLAFRALESAMPAAQIAMRWASLPSERVAVAALLSDLQVARGALAEIASDCRGRPTEPRHHCHGVTTEEDILLAIDQAIEGGR